MKITKLGHCCLLIEEKGARILTDPGMYSTSQNDLTGIDAVLITHEHGDHLHMDSLKEILKNNPEAQVITNTAVAKLLDEAGIKYSLLGDKANTSIKEVLVEALECPHAEIYKTWPRVLNTGFFIAGKLFYPGDAFLEPGKPVEILALPVAGPWMKASEGVEYALAVHPKVAFPVHDAMLKDITFSHRIPNMVLSENGIRFVSMSEGDTQEF